MFSSHYSENLLVFELILSVETHGQVVVMRWPISLG
jgi:hypothetical protein